jgi:hypothetical protein
MTVTRKRPATSKEEDSPAAGAAPRGYEVINSYTVRDRTPLTEKQKQEYADLQKPAHASEFGGVIGTPFLTIALPIVIYWVWASIEFNNGYLLRPQVHHHIATPLHHHIFHITAPRTICHYSTNFLHLLTYIINRLAYIKLPSYHTVLHKAGIHSNMLNYNCKLHIFILNATQNIAIINIIIMNRLHYPNVHNILATSPILPCA